MLIDYEKHRKAIERLYEDRADIYRMVEAEQPNHTTKPERTLLLTDQPCSLSQSGLGKNGQTPAQNDIRYDAKLFIGPDYPVLQGDEIVVRQRTGGPERKYTAGEPFAYPSHQEVMLTRSERA